MHHSLSSNDINPDLMGGFAVSPSPPSPGRIPLPAACLGVSSWRGSPVAGREGAGSPFPTGAGPVVIHFQACWPGPVKPPEHCCNTTQRNATMRHDYGGSALQVCAGVSWGHLRSRPRLWHHVCLCRWSRVEGTRQVYGQAAESGLPPDTTETVHITYATRHAV